MRFGRFLTVFLIILCLTGGGAALAEVSIEESSTEIGANYVRYPQLSGMQDEALQAKINNDLVEQCGISQLLVALATDDGWGLQADYDAFVQGDVFSVTFSVKRRTGTNIALCYDLSTGERIDASQLFVNMDEALQWMEQRLTTTYEEDASGYLEHSELTPIPTEYFALDADGITFYYPYESLSSLSGYAGACQFQYSEIAEYLNWDEGGVLQRMGMTREKNTDAETRDKIAQDVSQGQFPGFTKVKIGDAMSDVIERNRLLREPDQFPGGKYYQMESASFRQIRVLSDALTDGWEHSVVEGIQSLRADLHGLRAGETTIERWREVLGTPQKTLQLTENMAYDYALPVGTCDYYTFGEYELRLYSDENGLLFAAQISQ